MAESETVTVEPTVYRVFVENGNNYGEFFVSEQSPQPRSDGGLRYSATWCCYSSYGVFGHYWHDMGEPFAKFVGGVDKWYVVGKIATKEFDERTCLGSVRREVLQNRREKCISAEVAREGWEAINAIASESSGDVLAHELYMDAAVSKAVIDYSNLSTLKYPDSAEMFFDKLWALFVAQLQFPASEATHD